MSRGSWVEELKELLGRAKEAGRAEKSCFEKLIGSLPYRQ
jgi:hypothetical protein